MNGSPMNKPVLFILLLLCFAPPLYPDTFSKDIASINFNASTAAMAGMELLQNPDSDSIFHLIAPLSRLKKISLAFNYNIWFTETSMQSISAAIPTDKYGTLCMGFRSIGLNNISHTVLDSTGDVIVTPENFSTFEDIVSLAYARNLSDQLSAGIALDFLSQSLSSQKDTSLMGDLTLLFFPISSVGCYAGIHEIRNGPKYLDIKTSLPFKGILGTSYTCMHPQKTVTFTLGGETSYQEEEGITISCGANLEILKTFSLRCGFQWRKETAGNFSTGLSVKIPIYHETGILHYAFNPMGNLGYIHRIGFSILFGNPMRLAKPIISKQIQKKIDATLLTPIQFKLNSNIIDESSYSTLDRIGVILNNFPDIHICIHGHTDDKGDDAYNLKLSEERAQSVKDYLVKQRRIDVNRLSIKGHGKRNPISINQNELNRRVEFEIIE